MRARRRDVRRLAERYTPRLDRVASQGDACPLHMFERAIAIHDGRWTPMFCRNATAALARSPVLPEATVVGALSALLRHRPMAKPIASLASSRAG